MSGNNVAETKAGKHFSEAFDCLSTSPLHYPVSWGSRRPTFVVFWRYKDEKVSKTEAGWENGRAQLLV